MIAIGLGALATALIALMTSELKFRWRMLCGLLLRVAARRMPAPYDARLLEEWQSHVRDLADAPISALLYALARLCEAAAIRRELLPSRYDRSGSMRLAKRGVDACFASLTLVLIAPLMLVIAIAVRLDSPGPILFRQPRVGLDGYEFDMLKFRTVHSDVSDGGWAMSRTDSRTRVGRILRKLSLDELPQLVNVLRGEMSLVGPRPERTGYVRAFEGRIDGYGGRYRVKPGITGWAQVKGLSRLASLSDRAEWDNYYIENWSLWLDLKITLMTFPALLPGSRACWVPESLEADDDRGEEA